MSEPRTVQCEVHFEREARGRKRIEPGAEQPSALPPGRVTRPRVSQILTLVHLAPDIQEAILFLPRTQRGRDPVILSDVIPIAMELDWKRQRRAWRRLMGTM